MEEAGQMITKEEIDETDRLILLGKESEFIMLPEYSKNSKARHYRQQALDYYQSIHDPQTMDAIVPYVAVNFFDHVISKFREPPKVLWNKQENFTLFIISCHSLSQKLREYNYDVYKLLLDQKMECENKEKMEMNKMQLDQKMECENKEKMEMNILRALDRRKMKQTVPFRFVPYFLHFLTPPPGFTCLPVHKIIVWTQADIRFTKFRPSTVAASAILCASKKLFPDDPNDFTRVILSRYAHIDSTIRDVLAECVDMVQTTYQNKMNSLVIAKGLINDGVGTSQPSKLAPDEASTAVGNIQMTPKQSSSPGNGCESPVKRAHRPGKEPIDEESSEAIGKKQVVPKQSSCTSADDTEGVEEGLINDGVGTSQPSNLAPDEASTVPSGSGKEKEGSQRQGQETVSEEASEAVTGIQTVPEQSSSSGDGQESLEEGAQRQGKESVAEEASTAVGNIQTTPKQSSSPGNGCESPVKRSHRPGKEPIDEESSEAIGKKQVAPKQSSYTSANDTEGVEEGFCRCKKVPMVEMEKPKLAAVDNLQMNFELGWDDQNPYSHGYGMCSLCYALARCRPIPISEAREQTLEWLRDFWECLLEFGVLPV